MSAEAWKDTGNCRECRRRKYCKSECRASREAAQKIVNEIASRCDPLRQRGVPSDTDGPCTGKPAGAVS